MSANGREEQGCPFDLLSSPPSHQDWFTVVEHNRRPGCTVSDLVMGNEYLFRVFSENICGLSVVPGISENTAVVTKTGEVIDPPPSHKERRAFGSNFRAAMSEGHRAEERKVMRAGLHIFNKSKSQ